MKNKILGLLFTGLVCVQIPTHSMQNFFNECLKNPVSLKAAGAGTGILGLFFFGIDPLLYVLSVKATNSLVTTAKIDDKNIDATAPAGLLNFINPYITKKDTDGDIVLRYSAKDYTDADLWKLYKNSVGWQISLPVRAYLHLKDHPVQAALLASGLAVACGAYKNPIVLKKMQEEFMKNPLAFSCATITILALMALNKAVSQTPNAIQKDLQAATMSDYKEAFEFKVKNKVTKAELDKRKNEYESTTEENKNLRGKLDHISKLPQEKLTVEAVNDILNS